MKTFSFANYLELILIPEKKIAMECVHRIFFDDEQIFCDDHLLWTNNFSVDTRLGYFWSFSHSDKHAPRPERPEIRHALSTCLFAPTRPFYTQSAHTDIHTPCPKRILFYIYFTLILVSIICNYIVYNE